MKEVSIYSTPTCHFCHIAKDFFKENNIPYTEYDVSVDMAKRQEIVKLSGQMGVPVITIDNDLIVGFNEPRLRELLGVSDMQQAA
jgi:glutaredoxin-like YruB-family protein